MMVFSPGLREKLPVPLKEVKFAEFSFTRLVAAGFSVVQLSVMEAASFGTVATNSLAVTSRENVTFPDDVVLLMTLFSVSATYTVVPFPSTATPAGPLKFADKIWPSGEPDVTGPASVVTIPLGVILRMRLLRVSATYTAPVPSTATPEGRKKLAAVPCPSTRPENPEPARVVTFPVGVILRMRLLPVSATYTVPFPSTAAPEGERKLASVPFPSEKEALPLPASVVTFPLGVILRMRLFPVSATYTVPFPSTATPEGQRKLASVPFPSEKLELPLPASVVTFPLAVILRMRLL